MSTKLVQCVLRFIDLKRMGIVKNYPQLKNLQRDQGFPLGRWLSPNCRIWTDVEISEWITNRPIAVTNKPVKITDKHYSFRQKAAAADSQDGDEPPAI